MDTGHILIREARPEDAEQMIAHLLRMCDEPNNNILWGPGEFKVTVEEERKLLADTMAADNAAFFVAEAGGRVIGVADCRGGKLRANRHTAHLGISLHKDWRERGIGTAMMNSMVEWARGTGIISRIELEVFAQNARAIHVYEKCGFQIEGVRRRAFLKDGEYIDGVVMARLL